MIKSKDSLVPEYKGGREMPLEGYSALVGVFNLSFAGLLLAAQNSKRGLPEKINFGDLVLMGICHAQIEPHN